jgi:hypothetical protein
MKDHSLWSWLSKMSRAYLKAIRGQATKFRIGHGGRFRDCVCGISKPVPELR